MGWTDERVAELKRLVDSGLSGPDIASAMGVTRSVINGICGHRTEVGSWCPTHRAIVFTPRTEKRGTRVLEAA